MDGKRLRAWIGCLAAVAGAAACGGCTGSDAANTAQALSDLRNFSIMLEVHQMERERYPSTEAGLKALVEGGQIKALKADPWGLPYVYRLDAGGEGYLLLSVGPDGKEGTQDDISFRGPEASSRVVVPQDGGR